MFPRPLQWTFWVFWQVFLLVGFIKQPCSLLSLLTTWQITPRAGWLAPVPSPALTLRHRELSGWRRTGHWRDGSMVGFPGHCGSWVEPLDERKKKRKINVRFSFKMVLLVKETKKNQEKKERLPIGIKIVLIPTSCQIWTWHTPACNPHF